MKAVLVEPLELPAAMGDYPKLSVSKGCHCLLGNMGMVFVFQMILNFKIPM